MFCFTKRYRQALWGLNDDFSKSFNLGEAIRAPILGPLWIPFDGLPFARQSLELANRKYAELLHTTNDQNSLTGTHVLIPTGGSTKNKQPFLKSQRKSSQNSDKVVATIVWQQGPSMAQ